MSYLLVACGLKREAAIAARAGWTVVAGGGDSARLERELEALAPKARAILSFGLAGALDPALRAGDVVIGDQVLPLPPLNSSPRTWSGAQGSASTAADERAPRWTPDQVRGDEGNLLRVLEAALPHAHTGKTLGQDHIAATATEKTALRATTGASIVDMESHIAARVAARHALPFAFLRAISDRADENLPPAALVGMAPDGSMALGRVLWSLAARPRQLGALIRTGRNAKAAFQCLSRVAAALHVATTA